MLNWLLRLAGKASPSIDRMRLEAMLDEKILALQFADAFDLQAGKLKGEPMAGLDIETEEEITHFASDGAGGDFMLIGEAGRVLYVSSEGQAGIIGNSLGEALSIVVALPFWQDVARFFDGRPLEELRPVMHEAIERFEANALDDNEDLDDAREIAFDIMGIAALADPVTTLHVALTAPENAIVVRAPDGSAFEPLTATHVD